MVHRCQAHEGASKRFFLRPNPRQEKGRLSKDTDSGIQIHPPFRVLKREDRIGDHRGTQWYTEVQSVQRYRDTEWVGEPWKVRKENKHISHIGVELG